MDLLPTLPGPEHLSSLSSPDLELLNTRLSALRAQILTLQNSRAPLLRLPGEIRNQIIRAALRADLAHRLGVSSSSPSSSSLSPTSPSEDPQTLNTHGKEGAGSRGAGGGGRGSGSGSRGGGGGGGGGGNDPEPLLSPPALLRTCRAVRAEGTGIWCGEVLVWEEWDPGNGGAWRRMDEGQVRELRRSRAKRGPASVVMHRVYCSEERTKEVVSSGWGVCARRGVVRVEGLGVECGMRWWVW